MKRLQVLYLRRLYGLKRGASAGNRSIGPGG